MVYNCNIIKINVVPHFYENSDNWHVLQVLLYELSSRNPKNWPSLEL